MLHPENIEETLGFATLREQMAQACVSAAAVPMLNRVLVFNPDPARVSAKLAIVGEMMALIGEQADALPLEAVPDLRQAFLDATVDGTYLDLDTVAALRHALLVHQGLMMRLRALPEERFSHLRATADRADNYADTIRLVDSIIDKFGEVRDSASPELAAIRAEMREAQGAVARTLSNILRQAKAAGIIEPSVAPTMREGRLMLPVPAAEKRQIPGIVHDESATGRTAFIEPQAVVELNNRLRELEGRERREIIRILVSLTATLRPDFDLFLDAIRAIHRIDVLHAIGSFSIRIHATVPELTNDTVDIRSARHPQLAQALAREGRECVPLDIRLNARDRILIISGPNAGGKSVCLKTLGLVEYMLGCGLPVPVEEPSRMMIFSSILADIGDQQSIENDLSTYSSHLMNMKTFIRESDGRSLILIDEFGSGTEPLIGGAIAEAVLARLNRNGIYAVITTHYTNLKNLAAHTPGIVNGAMLYDRHNMQPLFTLSQGQAGSSFAIDIARKIGLPDDVIKAAIDLAGEEHVDADRYLQDAARDKRYWENKREKARREEKQMRELREQYEARIDSIKAESRRIIDEARAQAAELIAGANAQIEQTIRTIKESEAERSVTREARRRLGEQKQQLDHARAAAPQHHFLVGDTVRIDGQQTIGTITDIQGRDAVVIFGQIKTIVAQSRLAPAKAAPAADVRKTSNVVELIHDRQTQFNREIDLRGMRVDEALDAVVSFVDDAQMLHADQVRILHGTGTGALRSAIRQYLATCSAVESFRDEHVTMGGAGITVVTLRR